MIRYNIPQFKIIERFYIHLEVALNISRFIRKHHPGQIMNKLRRLFTRARPKMQEIHILHAILRSIENCINNN